VLTSDRELVLGGVARVELADDAVLLLKVMVVHVKEAGFSPFGGVNFDVRAVADVTVESLPEELKEKVRDRPVYYPWQEPPRDGWELVEIRGQEPAVIETTVNTSRGVFSVRVVAEVVMTFSSRTASSDSSTLATPPSTSSLSEVSTEAPAERAR